MNRDSRLDRLRATVAQRRLASVALGAAPLVVAAVALAARLGGAMAMLLAALLALAIALVALWRAWRGIDDIWLARRLDAALPAMDDSAALLFRDADSLSTMQRLQQARLGARLGETPVDLRPAWPWPRLLAAFGAALAIALMALAWPSRPQGENGGLPGARNADAAANATNLLAAQIDIAAPAYTRLAPRRENALDAKAPEGSHLRWTLRFSPAPRAAMLVFHDDERVAMTRDGEDWHAERDLTASTLYRIELDGTAPLADDALHRLDAIADRPPELRVLEPDKTLTLLDAQQKTWNLAFEADDDYGLAGAELQITLAQGDGENVKFTERTIALQGEPADDAKHRRYRHTLDLAALGIAQGDDVIVRLAVADNREPQPNVARSASFILRWPAQTATDAAGLEGMAQKTLPAYFRSQRQIIIDSEALLAERDKLDDKAFLSRSNTIGADQKILRLRYGQFLGEESETQEAHEEAGDDHQAHGEHAAPGGFGSEDGIVAEYGHAHDVAEAATLFDPETKALLKSALGEMWQSELHLRQGHPDQALPYEYRALDFVKRLQQSTRIYLARVGLELPTPDETRRLSGERKGLTDSVGTLAAANDDAATIARLWQTLTDTDGTPDWAAAEGWLRDHQARLPDALGVLAALDRARRDPACRECRANLRDLLWSLLPAPAAQTAPRVAPSAAGRAYLDALQAGNGGGR